jgi:hypothetical protein
MNYYYRYNAHTKGQNKTAISISKSSNDTIIHKISTKHQCTSQVKNSLGLMAETPRPQSTPSNIKISPDEGTAFTHTHNTD